MRGAWLCCCWLVVAGATAAAQNSPIDAALAAGVDGRCARLGPVDSASFRYWPAVMFYRADCVATNGDSLTAWVMRLPQGGIVPLGSHAAFDLLVNEARVEGLNDSTRLDYVRRGLIFNGEMPEAAMIASNPEQDLPATFCARSRHHCSGMFKPGFRPLSASGTAFSFGLTLFTSTGVYSAEGVLNETRGTLWPAFAERLTDAAP